MASYLDFVLSTEQVRQIDAVVLDGGFTAQARTKADFDHSHSVVLSSVITGVRRSGADVAVLWRKLRNEVRVILLDQCKQDIVLRTVKNVQGNTPLNGR